MAAIKYVDLTRLTQYDGLIKNYIGTADAKSFKTAQFDEVTRTLKFFKAETPAEGATADFSVEIPETDVSGLLAKLTGTVEGDVVIANADGTIKDSGVKLEDLATDEELKTVSDKADANATAIDAINNAETGILKQAKDYTDAEVKELADGQVATNKAAIETLNGDDTTEGSVKKAVKDASDAINAKIGTVADGKTVMGIIENIQENAYDDTNIKNSIGDLTTLVTTEKGSLVGAVNEVKGVVDANADAAKVTISTDATTEGYLKTYTIKQGDAEIGKIDIAKDLVVTSGEVVVDPEGQPTGTYVKLTIANQETPVYINVKDLCDVYTAQANAVQIQLAISETNEISATIVAGSVGTTELADAGVTAAKLADDAKALFDAANSASNAETNAKTYADGLNTAMDTRVKALEEELGDGIEAITEDEISALFA